MNAKFHSWFGSCPPKLLALPAWCGGSGVRAGADAADHSASERLRHRRLCVSAGWSSTMRRRSAVQTAWAQCAATGKVPATVNSNCAGLCRRDDRVRSEPRRWDRASQSRRQAESYCCPGAGTITCSGTGLGPVATTTPGTCTASGQAPGDYIFITASYTYSPSIRACLSPVFSPRRSSARPGCGSADHAQASALSA